MGVFRKRLLDATNLVTFRDVTLLPGWSEVEPQTVAIHSHVSTRNPVAIPFVSSPMDSVTESALAIAIARCGGFGFLHRNCTISEQMHMAQTVKNAPIHCDADPSASLDEQGRLCVGAAVGPQDFKRVKKLRGVVDAIVIDVAHFHRRSCFRGARQILKLTSVDVIVGNVGTFQAAEDTISQLEEIAGLRCGIGSGSTCTTAVQMGVGAPTLFAVASAADAAKTLGAEIPLIADGGIRNSGDAALALASGAWVVMLGNILAAAKESPSPIEIHDGIAYKPHWGMRSQRAYRKRFALDPYSQPEKGCVEGIEGLVAVRGSLTEILNEFTTALKATGGYIGAKNIPSMWERARFGRISPSGVEELQPHTLHRTSNI